MRKLKTEDPTPDERHNQRGSLNIYPPLIHIAPLHPFGDPQLIDPLARHVERVFGAKARVAALAVSLTDAFDRSRNQYNSGTLLLRALENAPPDATKILAVTDVDIFVPILTFLFGEAQYEGRAAVVSTCRLHPEFGGEAPDSSLLLERLLKEATHELGHTFGLIHCYFPGCVMNSSGGVEGVDARPLSFCERCRSAMALKRNAAEGGRGR